MAARFHLLENVMYVKVIYPQGDRSKLDVAWVRDYEADQWAIASSRSFGESYEDARRYAIELAAQHGLQYVGENPDGSKRHDYLD
jgi:hypothetical protein